MKLQIPTAKAFRPLLEPARYKGAWGGRGSGKSHFFGELIVEECILKPGTLAVCIREVQKTLAQSSKRLIENKIESLGVGSRFEVLNDRIVTPGNGLIIFQGMQDHTAESIKSLEGYRIAWVEEAQTLSARSLELLRPTIRAPGSEIWLSWNPRRKSDAVDEFLRGSSPPPESIVVHANWRDNPWFPDVLELERRLDLERYPERYEHIWEGGYATAFSGAYFSRQLNDAKQQGRIGRVAPDPLLPVRAFWDLGGAGATADAMAIWICQFVGQEIRVLDYLEGVGQVLAYYVNLLRKRGWGDVQCYLPHDGVNSNSITGKRYEDHLRDACFDVIVVPNQGRGAASMRIEAVRRVFPQCWFNAVTTEAGRDALGYYHEKRDDDRNVGLGPDHDWSSHCFVPETRILTRYGTYQIKDLPNTGEVLTPCGWSPYTHPRMTRRNAPLVEVGFADGLSVKCTPDHLFLTDSGWKSAESLTPNTVIRSSLTPLRSGSTAALTGSGQAAPISVVAARSYIATFGRWLSGQSRKDAISTIRTLTREITSSAIWNVFLPSITLAILGARTGVGSLQVATSARPLDRKRQNGTPPRRGGNGTGSSPSARRAGRNGRESKRIALNVAQSLMRSFARAVAERFIAALSASRLHIETVLGLTGGDQKADHGNAKRNLRIASVKRLSETSDVWCLTVPGVECFALENGAVVHNCADAFGLMAIVHREAEIISDDDDAPMSSVRGRSSVTGY